MEVSKGIIRDGKLTVLSGPLKGFEKYISHVDRHKRRCELKMELFGEVRTIKASIEVAEKT